MHVHLFFFGGMGAGGSEEGWGEVVEGGCCCAEESYIPVWRMHLFDSLTFSPISLASDAPIIKVVAQNTMSIKLYTYR